MIFLTSHQLTINFEIFKKIKYFFDVADSRILSRDFIGDKDLIIYYIRKILFFLLEMTCDVLES